MSSCSFAISAGLLSSSATSFGAIFSPLSRAVFPASSKPARRRSHSSRACSRSERRASRTANWSSGKYCEALFASQHRICNPAGSLDAAIPKSVGRNPYCFNVKSFDTTGARISLVRSSCVSYRTTCVLTCRPLHQLGLESLEESVFRARRTTDQHCQCPRTARVPPSRSRRRTRRELRSACFPPPLHREARPRS